ncbi:MAG: tRNA (N6-isopentenyl adenosine(37)-C2)-methylthiotransferase MiaB [Clostridia bacterium]|nr:tRNA (N6-isopentenyl adenosine(37)-C2)-methylthiotransferase MiaB [Clostridia bacterium]
MISTVNELLVDEYIRRVRELNAGLSRRAYVFTFGCQQNEADAERMLGMARDMGYKITDTAEDADLILINTCAIREHAELKALSMLGRFKALKRKNPELIIGVCGCMTAQPHRAELIKNDFHYVSFTTEPNMIHRIPELILGYMERRKRAFVFGADTGDIVEGVPVLRRESHKAFVSIMYGCNNFCSYCIVPYVRGRERSRCSEDIISECRTLVVSGVREITLLGQNVNSYRPDIGFAELISEIAEIEGDFIIRFMTSHPKDTSDELIEAMRKYRGKIAPYFHLPLQAGSNSVLRAMNRTYTREHYLEILKKLRAAVPDIAVSTDIIVGFPGESEQDFLDTLDVLKTAEFDMVYAFLYSAREGTRAAAMTEQVPREVKDERMSRLLALQDGISYKKNERFVGRVCRVLVDSKETREGCVVYTGRNPENKLVHFTSDYAVEIGELVNVKIEKHGAFDLIGTMEK